MEPLLEEVAVAATTTQEPAGVQEDQQEIIRELVAQASPQLSTEEQEQLLATLLGLADIFSRGPDDLGRTAKIKHEIDTVNAAPICQQVPLILPICRQEASAGEGSNPTIHQPLGITHCASTQEGWLYSVLHRLSHVKQFHTRMHAHFPESMTPWILSLELSGPVRSI
jgi:hypothetical protein